MDLNHKNTMSLEPRLVEYIKTKKKYKKMNINPGISLEETFKITKYEIGRAHV